MIQTKPLPWIGECYADEAVPFSSQDICNWLPTPAERAGTLQPMMARTPPGLSPFVQIAGVNGGKPVRGTYNCEGRLIAVVGNTQYRISNAGIAIPQGTIPGITRAAFTHNQRTQGNQLVTVNGSSGYVWDSSTDVFERIVDPGFAGGITADFIDGYVLCIEPGRRFVGHSDLANALEWNTLDRFTSEYKPDLLVTAVVSNNEYLLLSENSGEFFVNTGASQQPFRTKRIFFDKGCSGRSNAIALDNSAAWHGSDGVFYLLDGYSPKRISSRPIEQAVAGLNWSQAFAGLWESEGYSIAYWTFPDGHTWGWDASTGKWHRRASYGMDRWRVNSLTRWKKSAAGANDEWIAGDYQTGKLWRVDWDYMLEGSEEFISECTGPVISDSQNPRTMPRLELLFDTGQELTVALEFPVQPEPPTITGDAPDGAVSVPWGPFSYTLAGGTPPYKVTARPGTVQVPGNPAITSSGTLPAGTPTTVGNYPQNPRVTDANGLWGELPALDNIAIAEEPLEWIYQADAYGEGLGGVTSEVLPMAFGMEDEVETLVIAGPRESIDPAGTGNRFYVSTNYGVSFTHEYVPFSLAAETALGVYGNDVWVFFTARSTTVYDGANFTYTAGAVSGSWSGSEWACGVWTGSFFLASSDGTDGMFRHASGIGSGWVNVGANLPSGTSASNLLAMQAVNGAGPNPSHGAVVGMRDDTEHFVYTFDSGSTWGETTYATGTAGTKEYASSFKDGERVVFLTIVSNGASSGLEFVYTDDFGATFDSVFVLYSAMPAGFDGGELWSLLRADEKWWLSFSQNSGGGGTKSMLAEVSEDFTTITIEPYVNDPAPLMAAIPYTTAAVAVEGRRAVYGWRKDDGTPALFVRR